MTFIFISGLLLTFLGSSYYLMRQATGFREKILTLIFIFGGVYVQYLVNGWIH